MVTETWFSRDLPVLSAIVQLLEENPVDPVSLQVLPGVTGFDPGVVRTAVIKLRSANPPLLTNVTAVEDDTIPIAIGGVTGRALEVTGQWPSPESAIRSLISALIAASEEETDPEKKSKLRLAAETLGGIALQVAIGWASGAIPH